MTLTAVTKDRILTEILHGEPPIKPDTKEEKEFRKSLIAENAKVFKELEQAQAINVVMQIYLRKEYKSKGMSDEELEKELPLEYSEERIKKLEQVYKDWKLSERTSDH